METKTKKELMRGDKILKTMQDMEKNGNAWHTKRDIRDACMRARAYYRPDEFEDDLNHLVQGKSLHQEGDRYYRMEIWECEYTVANRIAEIISEKHPRNLTYLIEGLVVKGMVLNEKQREAIRLALSNKVSLILGGAGTGKTTLIEGIVQCLKRRKGWALCAPTGKASRNLTQRSGLASSTVYSLLRKTPNDNFMQVEKMDDLRMIIVDEASMLTLKEFAGLVLAAPDHCKIVLVGDYNQLLSVGAGNILPNLMTLNIPFVKLSVCHRQGENAGALYNNVHYFDRCTNASKLEFDSSFEYTEISNPRILMEVIANEAARNYKINESFQVIEPRNETVNYLNARIQDMLNPVTYRQDGSKREISIGEGEKAKRFRNGDRVMMRKNKKSFNYFNGDIGTLHILDYDKDNPVYSISFPDGRRVNLDGKSGFHDMKLAYAITIHKSQGSEYEKVLFCLTMSDSQMLYRNLIYTAISRARQEVKIVGEMEAIDIALKQEAPARNSGLVERVERKMQMIEEKREAM